MGYFWLINLSRAIGWTL